jgi:Rps23 Pro-64 3,4-dihydroxylase Tpa1-like proline 4-hydroxylase
MLMNECLNPIDPDALREQVLKSEPVPNFCIDNFLKEDFAREVAASYPSYQESLEMGRSFKAVNEVGKVQVTDSKRFAPAVAKLNDTLASPEFLALMSHAMGIPNLLADAELVGGGIHQTGPRGHLDVHVDFNYIEDRRLHRRLNILVYLNEGWRPEWGGEIELWDSEVKVCHRRFSPIFNRCVVFETNEISYHGVTAVKCPPDVARKSFAAYYYTNEAPAHWTGKSHSTIFKARPDEVFKGAVLMPVEKVQGWVWQTLRRTKAKIFG